MSEEATSAEVEAAPEAGRGPACGHHPDRPADGGTCERCGTFVCAECFVDGAAPPICAPCLKRLDRGPHLSHARVLGVLVMVHGGLMAAAGLYYMVFGGVMVDELANMPSDPELGGELPYFAELMGASLGLMGLFNVIPGALQLWGGFEVLRLRRLELGWLALAVGVLSLCGCYCFPTALVLVGYGAWVLSRDDVKARFRVRVPPATTRR